AAGVTRVIGIRGDADRFEPINSPRHDVGHASERLNVVDDGGFAEGAFDGRKGWFDSRPRPLAFEAFNQPGFLAANVCAGAPVQENIEMKVLAENTAAEQIGGIRFINGLLKRSVAAAVFITE